jgi:hypothetical protein
MFSLGWRNTVRIDCHGARIPALGGSADDRYTSIFENR